MCERLQDVSVVLMNLGSGGLCMVKIFAIQLDFYFCLFFKESLWYLIKTDLQIEPVC